MRYEKLKPHLNVDVLFTRFGGNNDFLHETLKLFMSQTTMLLEKIEKNVPKNDYLIIGRLAHELKGMCLTMEATELSTHARNVESAAQEQDNAALHGALTTLKIAFETFSFDIQDALE